eukprot:2598326-Prymnesium_polylepis.1
MPPCRIQAPTIRGHWTGWSRHSSEVARCNGGCSGGGKVPRDLPARRPAEGRFRSDRTAWRSIVILAQRPTMTIGQSLATPRPPTERNGAYGGKVEER